MRRNYLRKNNAVIHSAKGSTWEDHKYIKRIDGTYYYPDDYEGGRHLNSSTNDQEQEKSETNYNLNKTDIEKLANEVIQCLFYLNYN